MFFAVDLLCPQHGGKFSIAWICATRGVHSYRRRQILGCDLVKLCDDILEMIVSTSNRPKLRLSLSLSSRLICGAAKIYREQVKALEGDIVQFLIMIRRPQIIPELDHSSEPMPVAKVLRKRKKRNLASNEATMIIPPPEFIEEDLQTIIENMEIGIADGNAVVNEEIITLREEAPRQSYIELDNLRGEGDFGIIEDVNPPLFPDSAPKDTTILQQIEQQDNLPKTPTKRRSSRLKSTGKTDLEQITIQPEQIPQTEIPAVIEEIENTELPLVLAVPPETTLVQDQRPKKTKQTTLAKTLVKLKVKSSVNIDRTSCYDPELFDLWTYKNVVPITIVRPKLDNIMVLPLFACFMDNDSNIERFLSSVRASPRSRASLLKSYGSSHTETMHTRIIQTTQMPSIAEFSERHEIVVPVDVHPMPRKRKRTAESNIPEEILNINEIYVEPPPLDTGLCVTVIEQQPSITVAPPDLTVITELPPAAGAQKASANGKFIPKKSLTDEERHKRLKLIKHTVKDWDKEKQGEMSIEDVCVKPINRFNIAVAFCDLLAMHKMGYVRLHNKHNSLELGAIEKGPNVFKMK